MTSKHTITFPIPLFDGPDGEAELAEFISDVKACGFEFVSLEPIAGDDMSNYFQQGNFYTEHENGDNPFDVAVRKYFEDSKKKH